MLMKYITHTIENRKLPYVAAPRLEIYAHLVEEGFFLSREGEEGEFPSLGEGEDFGEFN